MSRRTGPAAATVVGVRQRDSYRCVRCGKSPADAVLSTQHRQARGMGGTRRASVNAPSNLITLCGTGTTGCHGWVEAHPVEARANGWAVASWDNPATTPVLTPRGWVLLDDDFCFEPLPDHRAVTP